MVTLENYIQIFAIFMLLSTLWFGSMAILCIDGKLNSFIKRSAFALSIICTVALVICLMKAKNITETEQQNFHIEVASRTVYRRLSIKKTQEYYFQITLQDGTQVNTEEIYELPYEIGETDTCVLRENGLHQREIINLIVSKETYETLKLDAYKK